MLLHPQDFSEEHRDKIPHPRLPIRFTVGTGRGPIPASGGGLNTRIDSLMDFPKLYVIRNSHSRKAEPTF